MSDSFDFINTLLCVKGEFILTFIKILLFGASVQLTSTPMDIDTVTLKLEAPKALDVVTSGAHLLIDISSNINANDLFEARNDVKSKYPEGCVKANMITRDKEVYVFSGQGILWAKGNVKLSLSSKVELETDVTFTKVELISCNPIRKAKVTWVNYKH